MDFIQEVSSFVSPELCQSILDDIVTGFVQFEKNDYNIHSNAYEAREIENNPILKDRIARCEELISQQVYNYFVQYDIKTFEQKLTGVSVLYVESGGSIPKHTDEQIDDTLFRNIGVLLYLNKTIGGELCFPLQKRVITPDIGKLVIFPSLFTHPHMVLPNTGTGRYALRFSYGQEIKSIHI
jgi:hypothetical protein